MKMIPLFTSHAFKTVFQWFFLGITLLFGSHVAALDDFNRLEKIGFSALPGNRVQIQLNFAHATVIHNSFSTNNPARIVLDFPKTKLGVRKKSQSIGIGVIQGTRVVETRDRTRVVIKLVRMVPFNINVVGKRVLVSIDNIAPQAPPQTSQSRFRSTIEPTSGIPRLQKAHIQDIDFRRTLDGAGRIAITLSDPSIVVDMRQEGTDIVLKFINTSLPKKLDQRLDVLDFGTPITFIDTFPIRPNVRMNITVKGDYEHHAYQTENIYIIEVKEKVKVEQETLKIEDRKYEGAPISFNFQNINVRTVLKLLFELSGENINMIAGEEISGSITLQLKEIPWDQALDIILEARGLGMRKIGNVVMIDLKKNIDERKQRELEAQRKIKELEPLHTEFIPINYAKATDLADMLGSSTDSKHSFLSNRGKVTTDKRTNTLIIQETASKIAEIRKLITSLDTPIRQVLIESRIVIATSNFTKDLGVKFGYSTNQDLGNGYGLVFGGRLPGDTNFSGTTAFASGSNENYIVSLPGASPAGAIGLAIGKIGSYLLQLELTAMQSEGTGEVLSNPRILTGNQQEASIMQGSQIAYVAPGGVGTSGSVEWKNATLQLKVIPQITPDDRINLALSVTKDAPGDVINGQTSIEKREMTTNV